MKKVLSVLLVILFVFINCSDNGNDDDSEDNEEIIVTIDQYDVLVIAGKTFQQCYYNTG